MKKELEIFIPVALDLDWPNADSVIECIREQNERYGFKNFSLACPGGGWRSKGYPEREDLDKMADLFNDVKRGLADTEIVLGWWNTLTIKSGRNEKFDRIVEASGDEHPFASCPLSEGFKKRFAEDVAYFATKEGLTAHAKSAVVRFEEEK